MEFADTKTLQSLLDVHVDSPTETWILEKLSAIVEIDSAKDLYMTYSLLGTKMDNGKRLDLSDLDNKILGNYLRNQNASMLQISRMHLLSSVLEKNSSYFGPKVANRIQVADTGELETFLKLLILLPHPENYRQTAVEALRTDFTTVFDAISADNPYPSKYFNDEQWSQMYLKAAFLQQDLSRILEVDAR